MSLGWLLCGAQCAKNASKKQTFLILSIGLAHNGHPHVLKHGQIQR